MTSRHLPDRYRETLSGSGPLQIPISWLPPPSSRVVVSNGFVTYPFHCTRTANVVDSYFVSYLKQSPANFVLPISPFLIPSVMYSNNHTRNLRFSHPGLLPDPPHSVILHFRGFPLSHCLFLLHIGTRKIPQALRPLNICKPPDPDSIPYYSLSLCVTLS